MGLQKHSKVLNDTVEMLSDEGSYHQLFHAYRDEEALPSGEVLKEIIDLCRAILFPGYYGNARISKQTIRFHTGVNVGTLHTLLSKPYRGGKTVGSLYPYASRNARLVGDGCRGCFQR